MDEYKREREQNKKKRRLKVTIILIALVILLGSFIAYGMREEKVVEKKEAIVKNKEEKKKGKKEKSKEAEEVKEDDQEIVEEDLNTLVKNSNHYKKAEEYAYETKEITRYIRPTTNSTHIDYQNGKKICFLTFDDGPNRDTTPKILDILKAKGVHGTFFAPGKNVTEDTKDILLRQLEEGHGIAMHSYTHDYDILYPNRNADTHAIINEARESIKAFQQVLGDDFYPGVWRYPGGHMSWNNLEEADKQLEEMNVEWIDWNCLTGDAEPKNRRPQTKEQMLEFTFDSLKYFYEQEIVVVLMHDAQGKDLTVEALPEIIDQFKDKGYEFGILK